MQVSPIFLEAGESEPGYNSADTGSYHCFCYDERKKAIFSKGVKKGIVWLTAYCRVCKENLCAARCF